MATRKQKKQQIQEEPAKLTVLPDANSYIDKLDIKKKRFVLLFTQLYGNISNTCAGIGISRQTYYDWLDKDENFAKAIMECEMSLNDEVREVLINKAATGDMTAVIFYLKNRHPDFKQERQQGPVLNVNFIPILGGSTVKQTVVEGEVKE